MLHLQGTHQYLINSANQEVSERTFLTPPKPVGYNSFRRHIDLLLLSILRRLLFDVILVNRGKTAMRSGNNTTKIIVQLCFAMRQPHRFLIVKIAGRQRFQPAMHSSKHSVRGSHRWQCHAYTTTSGTLCQYFSGRERRFRFSFAHGCLNHHESRLPCVACDSDGFFLDRTNLRTFRKGEPCRKKVLAG